MRPETEAWVEDAEYDLQSAKVMLDSGRYFFVVFMCHLTIEKLLKSVIVREHNRTLRQDGGVRVMVKTRTDLIASIRHYAEELERLGVPVERIILYGSHQRGEAHEDSDIDLAVFSEAVRSAAPPGIFGCALGGEMDDRADD